VGWDKVGSGRLPSGESFVIERHVIYLQVPKSTAVLPIRLRSYRWRRAADDGVWKVQDRADSRELIELAVDSYGRSTAAS
jgi:hypothetical protein